MQRLTQADYTHLLEFRTALRRFESWSEQAAKGVGLTAAQHQLLLAVKGHPGERGPTITDLAEYLLVRHHSVVGLVDRSAKAGLLARTRDPDDARMVRLELTELGEDRIAQLSAEHLVELNRLAPVLGHVVAVLPGLPG
jgi:DNA-binding MarR family transcriptional regulator